MGKASRRKREHHVGLDQIKAKVMKEFEPKDSEIYPPDLPKISVRLNQIMIEYLDKSMTLDQFKNLSMLAGIAWNLAVKPDLINPKESSALMDILADDESPAYLQGLTAMILKKKALYPDDPRLVMKTEVRVQPDGTFYLSVTASVPTGKPKE